MTNPARRLIVVILVLTNLLSACQALRGRPTVSPTTEMTATQELAPSPTPSPTLTPTLTPTSTPSPTPTLTPTPTLFVLDGTPVPPTLPVIDATTASQVSALAKWQVPVITDMAWTPDASALAVATNERIDLFDIYTRELQRSLYPQSKGLVSIAFSPDNFGSWLVAGSRWGSEQEGFGSALELWRGPDWQPRGLLSASERGLSQVAFSPHGKVLAAVYPDSVESENLIEFLDTNLWTISSTLQSGSVLKIGFSPNSSFLATTPDRYSVKVWDINRRALAFKFWTAFTDSINTLAYSPDGAILATGSYEGNITFWDMTTGVRLNTIPTDAAITSLAFSPDGQILATGSGFQDNMIRLWSTGTGELLRELDGNTQAVTQLLFSPDAQFIVSGSYNGDVILWGIRP